MTTDLVAQVASRLADLTPAGRPVLLAVSGGPDSVALLDLAVRGAAIHGRPLLVGHVDHGIADESASVAGQVVALAAEYHLECLVETLTLGPSCSETVARRARRAALRAMRVACEAGAIALAHHADDQVETVMLRFLRGSGPAGLAAMAPRRGPWVRPLLELPQALLRRHLDEVGLSSWHDPANIDPRHLRSWLRSVVLPLLEERLPDLRPRLLGLAEQARRDRQGWNGVVEHLAGLDFHGEEGRLSVAAPTLRGYRSGLQHAVLAALGRRLGVPLGRRRVARLQQLVARGRSGSRVAVAPGLEAEIAFDRLILGRPVGAPLPPVWLPAEGDLVFGPLRFNSRLAPAPGRLARAGGATVLPRGEYLVRSWRPGDRIRPLGGTGSRRIVVLLREAQVAAGRRRAWPVVEATDATIVWVPGICRAGGWLPEAGRDAQHVECDLA